ncbi:MAG: polysaccharide deacetylase family protein [Mobilitalea sp.]
MTEEEYIKSKHRKKKSKKIFGIITLEILTLLILFGSYRIFIHINPKDQDNSNASDENSLTEDEDTEVGDDTEVGEEIEVGEEPVVQEEDLSPEELEVIAEQNRLKKEIEERQNLIVQADRLALGYDYDGAIELIKNYKGSDGKYQVYPMLVAAIERLNAEKDTLVLYGGTYDSITMINHIFFHTLIADNSKAFDEDAMAKGYNMYMTTVLEFEKIIQKMYDDGYVLVRMSDITEKKTQDDGTTKYVESKIYLREGKKPFVLSEDDVSYYEYMNDDGFASRIVIGEDGRPTCEMIKEDGTTITGSFDIVPILDNFVELHPDFSYQGAKGLLALTGYEGILGYRTNNPDSPTYKEDREAVTKVADALKADGWEFGSHSWGHKNMQIESIDLLKRDTNRWLKEVEPLIGPTDIYVFPFGVDIETTLGTYNSDKYKFLKESGFNIFLGVYKEPWMHIKKDYVRMTRRSIDGQAMMQFPDRTTDLFQVEDILDTERPDRNW